MSARALCYRLAVRILSACLALCMVLPAVGLFAGHAAAPERMACYKVGSADWECALHCAAGLWGARSGQRALPPSLPPGVLPVRLAIAPPLPRAWMPGIGTSRPELPRSSPAVPPPRA